MKLLELFAGSRSVGKQAEKLGFQVFSVDWQQFEGIDLSIDIENLKPEHVPLSLMLYGLPQTAQPIQ